MSNCRVCLQLSKYLTLITPDYRNKFTCITGVELADDEEYICKACLGRLLYAVNFREDAKRADEWFKEQQQEEMYEVEQLDESFLESDSQMMFEDTKVFSSSNDTLQCDICPNSVTFKSKISLSKHMNQFHTCSDEENFTPSPYYCDFCGQTFKTPGPFTAHVQSHTNERIRCPQPNCKASFRQLANMNKHLKEAHATEKPFVCPICDEAFDLESSLRVHFLQKHENLEGGKLICTECGRVFKFPSQLKQHMASHFGEKNFECKICEKSYFKANNLRRHYQNAHLAEYKKMVASGKFRKTKGDEQIVTKEIVKKPTTSTHVNIYKCTEPDCNTSFRTARQLEDHLEAKHCIETAWVCEDCDASFMDLSGLQSHRKKMHTSKETLGCPECDKEFLYPSLLKNHVSSVHRGEHFVCEVCSRLYSRTSHLLRHYRAMHKDFYEQSVDEGKIRPRKSRKLC